MDARNLARHGLERARALLARPLLLNAALAALLGWQFAGLTWQAMPATAALPPPSGATPPAAGRDGDSVPPAARLAQLSLFGEPPAPESGAVRNAPETQLNLALKGIYAAGEGAGIAVISAGDGGEDVYAVGDRIAGSAHITGIFPDRVMLRRGGQAEVLRLPADEAELAPSTARDTEREREQARG
ncbi:MAG: type II secretion system protein N [Halofilum sp. (in: g-proteobacteria)]